MLIMLGTGSAIEEQCLFPYDNSCFVRELDKLKLYGKLSSVALPRIHLHPRSEYIPQLHWIVIIWVHINSVIYYTPLYLDAHWVILSDMTRLQIIINF